MERQPRLALTSVIRMAFVVIMCAAFVSDVWLVRLSVTDRPVLVSFGAGIMLTAGLLLAVRPAWIAVSSVIGVAASLTLTCLYWRDGFRFSFFVDAAVLPALFGGLLLNDGRTARVGAVVVGVVGLAVGLRSPDWAVRSILTLSMIIGLVLAGSAVAYVRVTDRERRSSVELARQAERVDLAREIHDVVGHHVTGMIVLAQGQRFVNRSAEDGGSEGLDAALRQIETAGHETMAAVRRLVGAVRSEDGVSVIHLSDVEELVEGLAASHPLTQLDIDATLRRTWVSPDLASTVYRIVREAVTNVRRHGDPESVISFVLERHGAMIVVSMENGLIADATGRGFGLVGMKERAELVGGTFEAGLVDHHRWRLCASLPVETASLT